MTTTDQKTHIDTLRNSIYLGGWDLLDEHGKTTEKIVTIKDIKKSMAFNQKSQKEEQILTVEFVECKPIILNSTNRKRLKKLTETAFIEDMIGKRIILTTEKVKAFGEVHDAVRISPKPVAKPILAEATKAWDNCVNALKSGKTMDDVRARYQVSKELESKLKEATNG